LRTRDVLLLSGIGLLLAAMGFVVLQTSHPPPADLGPAVGSGPAEVAPAPPPTHAPVTGELRPSAPDAAPQRDASEFVSSGLIEGDVAIEPRVLGKIEHVTILIRETLGSEPGRPAFVKAQSLPIERRTPYFAIDGIPFSDRDYHVTVSAPGCNGNEMYVRVTRAKPIPPRLQLHVTAGVTLSILLRDQFRGPVAGLDVLLLPVGEPPNRQPLTKTCDNFGAAVFEDVLRGEYRVFVGSQLDPLNEPKTIDVSATTAIQAVPVEVPRGQPLTVQVNGGNGYGLEGAEVVAIATDSVQFRQQKGKSDAAGRVTFKHLPAGAYQLNVAREGWERTARMVKIEDAVRPETVVVQLAPR
jgi:hypothetical protein